MSAFFEKSLEFLKGVGPQRFRLLSQELGLFTYGDFLYYYPFRYEDRTTFFKIGSLNAKMPYVQIKGKIRDVETIGEKRRKRLVARIYDDSGEIELVWFRGIDWVLKKLRPEIEYVVFGKPTVYGGKLNVAHPEIEILTKGNSKGQSFHPVYSLTEKLKNKYIDSKVLSKLQKTLLEQAQEHITETLPHALREAYKLMSRKDALLQIHFPQSHDALSKAQFRLKFEELFFIQLKLLQLKVLRIEKFRGRVFSDTRMVTQFYENHLPFELTDAQKRVIKEIYRDLGSGNQMNRLVQGDVGSGKTIVAFISALLIIAQGGQVALMAPTEILAEQHFNGLKPFAEAVGIKIAKLTGSSKKGERTALHEGLVKGDFQILVGTHALLEDQVVFKELGMAVVDEQHRFGVAQRAKLWKKNANYYPHVLVMTATPIPRTLAMTLYGDLDISTIDELPKGRKPIKTIHQYESSRLKVFGSIKKQIDSGRQAYVVYPLIEESEKLDLQHLTDGFESIKRQFPEYRVSILHGKMKAEDKDFEMQRFLKGETQIMVSTTVIEVGIDVPNATVMMIENAERFGLAQLHQLRGRVGRGAEQSYCILMSDYKLSKEARFRLETMVRTNDGFEIADADLKLRGPGDIMGTQQSGLLGLTIADLAKDGAILQLAREAAKQLIMGDPSLQAPEHKVLKQKMEELKRTSIHWDRIS